MKTIAFLFFVGSLLTTAFIQHANSPGFVKPAHPSDSSRFMITLDTKVGYINSHGEIVIEPQFESGQEFSEGLAAVRQNGLYGFIDIHGKLIIQPQFDFATRFIDGIATAANDGLPFYIDRTGASLFNCPFAAVCTFQNNLAQVRTHTKKWGAIDKTGRLVIDTVYRTMWDFEDGVAVAYGINHKTSYKEEEQVLEVTIIDTTGKKLIPYGKYSRIEPRGEGIFVATLPDSESEILIDKNGQERFQIFNHKQTYTSFDGNLKNGIIRVSVSGNSSEENYEMFVNQYGKPVFKDKDFDRGRDFSEGRAFVQNDKNQYSMIDASGKFVTSNKYSDVIGNGFVNGRAFVSEKRDWGIIDPSGEFIIKPKFSEVHPASLTTGFIFFLNEGDEKYGVADQQGNIIVEPSLEVFDERGFVNGLLSAYKDEKHVYINTAGKIVWTGDVQPLSSKEPLNIDFLNRGYFYARNSSQEHLSDGPYAYAQAITNVYDFPSNKISLIAVPERQHEAIIGCKSMTVFVANATLDTLRFNAQDGRLYMKMQAMDENGKWRDIEYLPSSWCGNSYHIISLDPKQYWAFAAPVYQGAFKTKLRFELKMIDSRYSTGDRRSKTPELTIYSNEFAGSVNPGQFWRKREYVSDGIMDPYND